MAWRWHKNNMALLINVTSGMWMTHHLVIDTSMEMNLRCEEFAWVREIRWNKLIYVCSMYIKLQIKPVNRKAKINLLVCHVYLIL
jgi:hypothetical protein